MTNVELIMEALMIEPTPNTPAQYSEDKIMYEKDALLSLLENRLQGEPAARDLTKQFLQNPAVWEGALVDALHSADVLEDERIIDQAQKLLKVSKAVQPLMKRSVTPEASELPSTIPGVLAER